MTATKKKKTVGRPRKVVDNTATAEPKPTVKDVLTLEQRMAIGKARNAMANMVIAYRQMRHPTTHDVFALNEAYDELQDVYHAAWSDR